MRYQGEKILFDTVVVLDKVDKAQCSPEANHRVKSVHLSNKTSLVHRESPVHQEAFGRVWSKENSLKQRPTK